LFIEQRAKNNEQRVEIMLTIKEKVNNALELIRPYLVADGGNVELIEITDTMQVKVKLIGACHNCKFSINTLKAGIEMTIMQEVPEIIEVIAV
jgi:Fe-S cluster biogenesis protein NfuA